MGLRRRPFLPPFLGVVTQLYKVVLNMLVATIVVRRSSL